MNKKANSIRIYEENAISFKKDYSDEFKNFSTNIDDDRLNNTRKNLIKTRTLSHDNLQYQMNTNT